MSPTPLPPFPRPSVFDPGRFGVAYSQGQMVDFATQARADLEAENARLREALALAVEYWRHLQQRYKNRSPVWVEKANAALKGIP